jgi:hypothetical protein
MVIKAHNISPFSATILSSKTYKLTTFGITALSILD